MIFFPVSIQSLRHEANQREWDAACTIDNLWQSFALAAIKSEAASNTNSLQGKIYHQPKKGKTKKTNHHAGVSYDAPYEHSPFGGFGFRERLSHTPGSSLLLHQYTIIINNSSDKCCGGSCCPYGAYFTLPAILVPIATYLTWHFTYGCQFVLITSETSSNLELGLGPWLVEEWDLFSSDGGSGTCVTWEDHDAQVDEDIDGPIKFTRAVTMMVSLLSLIHMIAFLVMSCCKFPKPIIWGLTISAFVFALMSILTMAMFGTDICSEDGLECEIGGTGIVAIVAFIIWIGAGVSMIFLKPKDGDEAAAPAPTASAVVVENSTNAAPTDKLGASDV